jgi:hypothetical protein
VHERAAVPACVAVDDEVGALVAVTVDVASGVALGGVAVVPAHAATNTSAKASGASRMREIMKRSALRAL